ncbi:hypothetical protein HanRHA438_Chr10g0442421 [Helianthus annuus]|nr:hypothetical protein HanRHA438_Chr10g0442421 [Helianthus annuus]
MCFLFSSNSRAFYFGCDQTMKTTNVLQPPSKIMNMKMTNTLLMMMMMCCIDSFGVLKVA